LFDSIGCCLPLCALAFLSTQLAYSHRSIYSELVAGLNAYTRDLLSAHGLLFFSTVVSHFTKSKFLVGETFQPLASTS